MSCSPKHSFESVHNDPLSYVSATQKDMITSEAYGAKVSQVIQNPETTMHLKHDLDEMYKSAERNSIQVKAEDFRTSYIINMFPADNMRFETLT